MVVTLKAHSLPAAAPVIASMLAPEGAAVMAVNGVPYWYFHGIARGEPRTAEIESVDPGGAVWAAIPPVACDRAAWCIPLPRCPPPA